MRIAVVGGGIAAWAGAVALRRALPHVPLVLVGGDDEAEATHGTALLTAGPALDRFHRLIGIAEPMFVTHADARRMAETADGTPAQLLDIPYVDGVAFHQLWLRAVAAGAPVASWRDTVAAAGHAAPWQWRFAAGRYAALLRVLGQHVELDRAASVPAEATLVVLAGEAVHGPAWQGRAAAIGGLAGSADDFVTLDSLFLDIMRLVDHVPADPAPGLAAAEFNRRTAAAHAHARDWLAEIGAGPDTEGRAAIVSEYARRGRVVRRDDDPVTEGQWLDRLMARHPAPRRIDPTAMAWPMARVLATLGRGG